MKTAIRIKTARRKTQCSTSGRSRWIRSSRLWWTKTCWFSKGSATRNRRSLRSGKRTAACGCGKPDTGKSQKKFCLSVFNVVTIKLIDRFSFAGQETKYREKIRELNFVWARFKSWTKLIPYNFITVILNWLLIF